MYCIDASVILSAIRPKELLSAKSQSFLNSLKQNELKVFCPEIIVSEIASGLFRATKDAYLSRDFSLAIRDLPNFSFVAVDSRLVDLAVWVIMETGLRGADAIYVALAYDYQLELITLDKEQLQKGGKIIKTRTP